MSETKYYRRGRRFISREQAANRAAVRLGESMPFPPHPSKWQRIISWIFRVARLRQKNPLPSATLPRNPKFIWWGGLHHPKSEATGHFGVIGGTGVGKTLILDSCLQSVLRDFHPGADRRALIFDVKREQYSRLMNMNLQVPIHVMDPFSQNATAWAMNADITSPVEAQQAADCFVHGGKNEKDTFWIDATRNVLGGVFTALAELYPDKWSLRDALLFMRSPSRIAHLLGLLPETAHLWSREYRDERTVANLMESFNARLNKYSIVAALWDNCPRKISLKEWVKSDSVFLLPSHPKYSASLQPIHQLIFRMLTDLVLSQTNSRTRRNWFFLDECRYFLGTGSAAAEALVRLGNLGRSKGASLALGLQSVEGFYDACGSEHAAHEVLGNIRHMTYLRGSPTTCSYAEKAFGTVEWLVEKETVSRGSSDKGWNSGRSVDHHTRCEPALMASEIMGVSPPSEDQPVVLFNDSPGVGSYVSAIPVQEFLDRLVPPHPTIPDFVEVLPKQMRLKEWGAADAKRLRLPRELLYSPPTENDLLLSRIETLNHHKV